MPLLLFVASPNQLLIELPRRSMRKRLDDEVVEVGEASRTTADVEDWVFCCFFGERLVSAAAKDRALLGFFGTGLESDKALTCRINSLISPSS